MPEKITSTYIEKQLVAGFTHIVVCERSTVEQSEALSAHRNYESARKALHKAKRANALWILEDVRRQFSANRRGRV